MKTAAALLLAGLALVACAGGRGTPDEAPGDRPRPADTGTSEGRADLLDALAATLRDHYVGDPVETEALLSLLTESRQRLLSMEGSEAFYDALNGLLRGTGNQHLYLYQPDRDLFDREESETRLAGATSRNADGYSFVDDVWEGSPAEQAGLRYGDELLPIDGIPASLDPIESSDPTLRLWVRRTRESEPFFVEVEPVATDTLWYLAESTRASIRTLPRGDCRVGLVHLRTFADEDLIEEMITGAHFDEVDGLIIDLRRNRGGEVRLASRLFDLLTRQPSLWIHYHERRYTFPPTSWNLPLAVLVDGDSRSAAEIFAAAVQIRNLGTVVGTASAGQVQAGRLFDLPDGSRVLVPVTRVTLPDGSSLDDLGVVPDVVVERPLFYAAGADPPLERALTILDGQLACPAELPDEAFPQEKLAPPTDAARGSESGRVP